MSIDVVRAREHLRTFDFQRLFIDHLGWNHATGVSKTTWDVQGMPVTRTPIAELSGVIVFEIRTADGEIPDTAAQRSIHSDIANYHHENLLIFLDVTRKSSVWYWVKRDGGKSYPRSHSYVYGQPGDLLIGKLSAMFVDIGELDPNTGRLPLIEAIGRVRQALDVEPVTKRFFSDFQRLHGTLLSAISGISDERDRRWYASVLLNRLMFVYFLQRRGFLDGGNYRYLQQKLAVSQQHATDQYYPTFLRALFFEGFAKPVAERSATATALIGEICYLNGGLFLPHQVEQANPAIAVPDAVFGEIYSLFDGYDWVLDDSPTGNEREINPAVLGYIFEKYINQKAFGAYYTRSEITEYLCEQTIHRLVLDRINRRRPASKPPYQRVSDLLIKPEVDEIRFLLLSDEGLSGLKLIDPACGSGAFLVAAMRTLINIYSALVGKAEFSGDSTLDAWLARVKREHPSIDYYIKKQIILNNLFGVDIMAEAIEIARLRLFLALVAAARTVDDLEPLPNIDFNILAGNALIGLLRVDTQRADAALLVHGKDGSQAEQLGLFADTQRNSYAQIVAEKNRLVRSYRHASETLTSVDLSALRDDIQRHRIEAAAVLDELLLNDFQALKIRYEQTTWDAGKGKEGKPTRRPLTIDDIRTLQPFHWGYEFDEVMNERGGFDAIIANPPWETLKPDAKEFFAEHSNLVSKKKMTVKDFEQEQAKLLQDREILDAWLAYLNRFTYQSEYFRAASQFQYQSAVIAGKRTGTDINLYKLFVEQCFNLLHTGGQCGIVVPSGIYTDMGATGLRKLLFEQAQVCALLAVSNERYLFEGVHHNFKYVFMTFEKGGQTEVFDAAFRIQPREAIGPAEIDEFLNTPEQHLKMSLSVVRQLSVETLSVLEFRSPLDIIITQKLLNFPSLGARIDDSWNLVIANEFHMTNDSHLFRTQAGLGRLPLVEGKMFHQFSYSQTMPKYWIDEHEGRAALLGRVPDTGQQLPYQKYRLAFRDVARSTNERTLIATILQPGVFCPHTVSLEKDAMLPSKTRLYLVALLNSIVLDYQVRQRVWSHVSFFFVYQLPVPRLTAADSRFAPIVERAAKLICTTPDYDALAAEVGLGSHTNGVTDPSERNRLRAELDGLVAHLYGLSESELTHILGTFPLVDQAQKDAVLTAFHAFAPNPDDAQVAALISAGESERVEFKVAAFWNARTGAKDASMRDNVVQAVAAFLNSSEGGIVLIGVEDGRWKDEGGRMKTEGSASSLIPHPPSFRVVGLSDDYRAANPQKHDRDGYELALRDVIGTALGQAVGTYLTFAFHKIGGLDVCRILVRPASAPVYLNGELYVRIGNGKKKLNAQQVVEYVRRRW